MFFFSNQLTALQNPKDSCQLHTSTLPVLRCTSSGRPVGRFFLFCFLAGASRNPTRRRSTQALEDGRERGGKGQTLGGSRKLVCFETAFRVF